MIKGKLKIGFYCSSVSWGGLEMNMIRHAKWMKDLGWDVIFFCVRGSKISQECEGLEVYHVNRNKKYFDYKNATLLSKLIPRMGIDLIWIRDTRDMSTIGLAKRKSGKAFKVLYQQAMQLGVDKKDFIHTRRFGRIDLWISPLEFLANQVVERTHYPKSKIRIIPLGINVNSYNTDEVSKGEARDILKIGKEKYVIGIIGRFDPQKGQLFLLKSFYELRKLGLEVELLMVGDKTEGEGSAYFDEIETFIAKHKLEDVVFVHPFMKQVNVFYKAIDCFVMASEGETFGMVTLEAMLFGLPIIGTDTSGTPELLENGDLGLLYEPNNKEAFLSKAKELMDNKKSAIIMGVKAQESVIERFDHQAVCKRIEEEILRLF